MSDTRGNSSPKRRHPELVSVVIPVLDAATTLPDQLDALARQDYEGPFEVIVADNGSSDGSAQLALDWADRITTLKVVDASDRRGINHARNVGVAGSSGDFIANCDADDVCSPVWLRELAEHARYFDIVKGAVSFGPELNDARTLSWHRTRSENLMKPRHGFLPAASASNCGVWREVVDALGGWDESYVYGSTDTEWVWRAQLAGYTLGAAPGATVNKRYRTSIRGLMRQRYRQGRNHVRLYAQFRAHGMPRSSPSKATRIWARLVLGIPRALSSPAYRGEWAQTLALRAGRFAGTLKFRRMYL